jgi:hypothetical protein
MQSYLIWNDLDLVFINAVICIILKLDNKAVMVEVSEDIFYQVKKEILDKLDLILQKINL